MMQRRRFLLAPLALAAFVSCGAPRPDPGPPAPAVPGPWTTRFMTEGFLVADRVEIHGPNGLLEHVAATQDPDNFVYRAEHVGSTYRQTWERRPGAVADLRAQLDAWAIVAVRRLTIVEHLDAVPVTLRGAGNVAWHDAATGSQGREAAEHVVVGRGSSDR